MKLLAPVIMLLVLCSMATAEVVVDFEAKCPHFFIQGHLPTVLQGPRYKQICQRYKNMYYFATLYDTENKIPVYCASRLLSPMKCTRKTTWFIEPQLDGGRDVDMATECSQKNLPSLGNKQALNEDYTGSGFDRGHLLPVAHQPSQQCADTTFTLTNAAPQNPSFNRGQWRVMEEHVAELLDKQCISKKIRTFIITGVLPGNNKMKNRVNIPGSFWSAYCCINNNDKVVLYGAYYALNQNDKVTPVSVAFLQTELSKHFQPGFQLFGGKCA